jgi:hypothetical protein
MSNILGTLFGDIAGAIRDMTGDTATMKPTEFPEKILGISGGGSGDKQYELVYSQFTPNTAQATIEHNLGKIPDVFMVFLEDIPINKIVLSAWCFSPKMMEAFGVGNNNMVTIYSGQSMSVSSSKDITLVSDGSTYYKYGGIHSFTDTHFSMGGSSCGLYVGKFYRTIAICGLC